MNRMDREERGGDRINRMNRIRERERRRKEWERREEMVEWGREWGVGCWSTPYGVIAAEVFEAECAGDGGGVGVAVYGVGVAGEQHGVSVVGVAAGGDEGRGAVGSGGGAV